MEDGEELTVRINTPGGDPEAVWGMVARLQALSTPKYLKVDGQASSAGFYLLCYFDEVECLDVSSFIVHRGKHWREDFGLMEDSHWKELDMINGHLRKALEAKIDVPKFETITGVKIKDIFDNKQRIDVMLTAKQAKQVGLVSKINTITPAKKKEIVALAQANRGEVYERVAAFDNNPTPPQKTTSMLTLDELKQQHPNVFAEAFNKGVEAEKDRVLAFMEFADVDIVAVKAGIEGATELKGLALAKLSKAAATATRAPEPSEEAKVTAAALGKEAAKPTPTVEADATVKTAEQIEIEAFSAKVEAYRAAQNPKK